MKKTIRIKLDNKDIEVIDDIDLIVNNLEFLGFAKVVDIHTNSKIVFTTESLILMEELGD